MDLQSLSGAALLSEIPSRKPNESEMMCGFVSGKFLQHLLNTEWPSAFRNPGSDKELEEMMEECRANLIKMYPSSPIKRSICYSFLGLFQGLLLKKESDGRKIVCSLARADHMDKEGMGRDLAMMYASASTELEQTFHKVLKRTKTVGLCEEENVQIFRDVLGGAEFRGHTGLSEYSSCFGTGYDRCQMLSGASNNFCLRGFRQYCLFLRDLEGMARLLLDWNDYHKLKTDDFVESLFFRLDLAHVKGWYMYII